ncbi:MAG: hypothetical protein SFW36_13005 [Leptolyngbyaceae cyanobacterium bins.59]|nr:hypothetical protein [Leptolyngbyaceae cyanobacterium bins.59]
MATDHLERLPIRFSSAHINTAFDPHHPLKIASYHYQQSGWTLPFDSQSGIQPEAHHLNRGAS